MTTIDTLFVSRLGAAPLAGVGLGGILAFAIVCFGIGSLRSVKLLVSQARGARKDEQAQPVLGAGLVLAVVLGSAGALLGLGIARVLPELTASRAAGENAAVYLAIRSLGAPIVLVGAALREARYGDSDARSPMIATLIANLLHVPLNAFFIFALEWGIASVAIATVLSQCLEAGLLARVQAPLGFGLRSVRRHHVRELWQLSWPLGGQFLLEVGAFTCLVVMLARISESDLAAHQIVLQFTHVSFLPALAIGEAASILVGQAVGANRDELVRPVSRAAAGAALLYTGACAVVFAAVPELLVRPFAQDHAVASIAIKLCYIAAIFQIFDGASIVVRSVLRGVGDLRFPAVLSVCTAWLCTPPLTYALGIQLELGAVGGWIGLCLELMVGSAILWWRFLGGSWRREAQRSRERLVTL